MGRVVYESCVLATNVLVLLGLVFLGVGVVCEGPNRNGMVKLVRAERVPSGYGVVLRAKVDKLVCTG